MFKIIIDPGHGKNDNKGVYPEYKEGTQMWKLAQKELALLVEYECEITTTRPSIDDNPTPEERGKMAAGYDFFLSLHSNTPGSEDKGKPSYEATTGSISFYSITKPGDKTFATDLVKKVAEIMGNYSRGAKTKTKKNGEDYYSVIRNSIAVGCKHSFIIEHGFHTNKKDCAFLLSDANLEKLAEAEVALIASTYGLKKKVVPPTPVKEEINVGDLVSISEGATYWNGKSVPASYLKYNWYVTSINHTTGRTVLGKSEDGKHTLNSAIDEKYLTKVNAKKTEAVFPSIMYAGSSITEALELVGAESSYSFRKKIAKANGISLYIGTSSQNQKLLSLLRQGKLKQPALKA